MTEVYQGRPCKNGHVGVRRRSTRQCIDCKRRDDRYRKNPERERDRSLISGWKRKGYPAPTRPRPERCEACGGPPTARRLHLDHDHKTGRFRGWLCHFCNTNLGRIGDDANGMKPLLAYLKRSEDTGSAAWRKERPLEAGVLSYFPDALLEVAHCSYVGSSQHHPGEPIHWDKSKSSDEADALLRHLLRRGTLDTDGVSHTAKVAWRALALLQREIEAKRG